MAEPGLANARIVFEDRAAIGCVELRDGRIAAIHEGRAVPAGALDLEGDTLIPGLVELHTDNLEKHLQPRPGVNWPLEPAVLAHDAQIAAAGITTVFDALSVGDTPRGGFRSRILKGAVETINCAQLGGRFRSEHFLHLRCEISDGDMRDLYAAHAANPLFGLVSIMDHTPGQRQWADIGKYRARNKARLGLDEAGLDDLIRSRLADQTCYAECNREAILAHMRERRLPIASHDDTTAKDVAESLSMGATICEFPTTVGAAEAARAGGMKIVMGAPNVVLGGSHSGNVGATELAEMGLLDILSSDYVPASLLSAVWKLAETIDLPLHRAVALVTANPARAVGLRDRGAIAVGNRADLVRVRERGGSPQAVAVWRAGERIA